MLTFYSHSEILFIMYYPSHLKYEDAAPSEMHAKPRIRTKHWALSVILGWVIFFHLFVLISLCSHVL